MSGSRALVLVLVLVGACAGCGGGAGDSTGGNADDRGDAGDSDDGGTQDHDGVGDETACAEAAQRLGKRVCVHALPERELWEAISFPASAVDQARTTTYLMPAVPEAPLPTVFVDASGFEMPRESLHYKFLTETVEEFELLEYMQYLELTLDAERREFFAGSITEYLVPGEEPFLGFTIWDMGTDPQATIRCAQFEAAYGELSRRISRDRVGELVVVAANELQSAVLEECDVPRHDPSAGLEYEAYTRASGCGRLRLFTLEELALAEQQAELSFQDVLVVDQAPLDIETIIAGVVTGTRQGELSHLNVRSASRGTPNCYVRDANVLLEALEGELVRLECGPDGASVLAISADEAAACQAGVRPEPVEIVPAELGDGALVPLLELPTGDTEARRSAVGRFGSKGANLAALYQRIDPELQLQGFLIPLQHHDRFMRDNTWQVDMGEGLAAHSFVETLDAWLDDDAFMSDGVVRRERLAALQAAIDGTPCDAELLSAIGEQILAIHGDAETMVRFRSSSNAEDALDFNGAGLYSSTSVCLADDLDDDLEDGGGPSRCDPDQAKERGLCRGLTRVWGSLWNMKAFEEREWYGIDHRAVGMGVLVNTRTKGELANIVAFSGNPLLRGDDRYLINAQAGELDVVAALPGVWPEKDLLTLESGVVVEIERARGSTELPEGEWVLSDTQLEALGAALATIVEVYPLDGEVPSSRELLLDTEWKLRADGRLAVKQVRPFLK